MKFNQWTLGLAAVGIVSLATVAQAEENAVNSAFAGLTMSGAVETSASINTARNGALPGRSFDGADRQDGFNFNSARLTLEKAVSEDQFAAGFRTDFVYGPDADAFYGGNSPIKQAYVALRAPVGNGIDIKMGVFDTPIGYEQFDSGSNPNFSRSYGFLIEPNHHTGVLASYKIVDALSVSAGVANSYNGVSGDFNGRNGRSDGRFVRPALDWQGLPILDDLGNPTSEPNGFRQDEGRLTYMATVKLTLPEGAGALKGSTIDLGIIHGKDAQVARVGRTLIAVIDDPLTLINEAAENQAAVPSDKATTSYYVGTTINTGITGLTLGAAFDYRRNEIEQEDGTVLGNTDADPVFNNAARNNTYAVAGYVSYAVTEKLKLNARYDIMRGNYPVRDGFGDIALFDENPIPTTTTADDTTHRERLRLQSLTLTAQYDIWANVLTRLEGRWDHGSGDSRRDFGASQTSNDAFTIAADVIYKF